MINKFQLYINAIKHASKSKAVTTSLIAQKVLGNQSYRLPWFIDLNPSVIIDVGAHIGESSKLFRNIFPNAQIYAFEPNPDCYNQLNMKMIGDNRFRSYCVGLGDKTAKGKFNVNHFSPSSSFLKTSKYGTEIYPQISGSIVKTVDIKRLDDFKIKGKKNRSIILKIDVQGFEDKVLLGAKETCKFASAIIIETSFVRIYRDQPLFNDINNLMNKQKFTFSGFSEVYINTKSGKILFTDSIFIPS